MGDHDIYVFILFAHVFGYFAGDRLHVEGVRHAYPLKVRHAGDAGNRLHFVDRDRVDDEGRYIKLFCQIISQHRP